MQALFFLAFVLALRESSRNPELARAPSPLRPGRSACGGLRLHLQLPWSDLAGGALVLWVALERGISLRPALLGLGVFVVLVAPEIGRMIDFHSFETFDPNGPGLGNLFGQISPFEGFGIWPSGDFRLTPGARGCAGLRLLRRRGLRHDPAALRAGALLAPPRVRAGRRPRRGGARLRRRPARRHALHRRQGDRGRRAAGGTGHRLAAAAPPGGLAVPLGGGRLLAACACQCTGRSEHLLIGADRLAR